MKNDVVLMLFLKFNINAAVQLTVSKTIAGVESPY